ncbi:MAG TPA: aromatic ring-hydroxylating dioxygenase subunit alpha [Acidimicrobiia bacterium]|nr:aromatic ring-hydroxylating dioxygenase subunit alpha [Acidimicrobiia bacterium]
MRDRAPIDSQGVEAALAPFGESVTLPGDAYTSDGVLAFEVDRFFTRGWVCAGRVDGLVAPNQARAIQLGNEPILLMRDGDGALRAFYNTCRHRAHELLPIGDAVDMRVLKCPYHAWTYSLEGDLKGAPSLTRSPDFDKADYPLIEVATGVWGGFLFIDPSGMAGPLADHLGNLDEVLGPWQIETLRPAERHDYEIAANWKLVVENYHECYHCSSIHPALCKVSPPDSGVDVFPTGLWCGGDMDLMDHAVTMSFDGASHGTMIPALDDGRLRKVMYIGVMPNLLISAHPDYVMTHRLTPLAPNRSYIECEWLFPPEAFEKEGFDPAYAVDFWDVTNREDWAACEAVQRGIVSRGYRQGPLSPWESTLHQFYQMVGNAYLGHPITAPKVPVSSRD